MTVQKIGASNYRVKGHGVEALTSAFVELAEKNTTSASELSDALETRDTALAGEEEVGTGRMSSMAVRGKERILFRYKISLNPPIGYVMYEDFDPPHDEICLRTAQQWDRLAHDIAHRR